MQFGRYVQVASSFSISVCLGSAALSATPKWRADATELSDAIDHSLVSGREETIPPEVKIPGGDYPLCQLAPALVLRNMIGGTPIRHGEVQTLYGGWRRYVRDVSAALLASEKPTTRNLIIRATLDKGIRSKIGQFGVVDPQYPAMKHYQALLWSASCLIDRANTDFLRGYLDQKEWPSDGDPTDERSPSRGLFLLIQHSLLTAAEKEALMPRVETAFRRKLMAPFDYARLVDRTNQARAGVQKYGTQVSYLDGRKVIEGAVGCRLALDENRKSLGLEPLAADVVVQLPGGEVCKEP